MLQRWRRLREPASVFALVCCCKAALLAAGAAFCFAFD
jgi:hypothetical protein